MKNLKALILEAAKSNEEEPFQRSSVSFKNYLNSNAEGTGKTELVKVDSIGRYKSTYWYIVNNSLDLTEALEMLFDRYANYKFSDDEKGESNHNYQNVIVIPLSNCLITIDSRGYNATGVKSGDEKKRSRNYEGTTNFLQLWVSAWSDYKTMKSCLGQNTSKSFFEQRITDKDLEKEYRDTIEEIEDTDWNGQPVTRKRSNVKKFWESVKKYIPEIVEDIKNIINKNKKAVRVTEVDKSGKAMLLSCPYKLSTKVALKGNLKTGKAEVKNSEEGIRFFVDTVTLDGTEYYIVYFVDIFDFYYNSEWNATVIMNSLGNLDKYFEWERKPARYKKMSELGEDGEVHVWHSAMAKKLPAELKKDIVEDTELADKIYKKRSTKMSFDKMMKACYTTSNNYYNHKEKK